MLLMGLCHGLGLFGVDGGLSRAKTASSVENALGHSLLDGVDRIGRDIGVTRVGSKRYIIVLTQSIAVEDGNGNRISSCHIQFFTYSGSFCSNNKTMMFVR